jgi:hypothetical protein
LNIQARLAGSYAKSANIPAVRCSGSDLTTLDNKPQSQASVEYMAEGRREL